MYTMASIIDKSEIPSNAKIEVDNCFKDAVSEILDKGIIIEPVPKDNMPSGTTYYFADQGMINNEILFYHAEITDDPLHHAKKRLALAYEE